MKKLLTSALCLSLLVILIAGCRKDELTEGDIEDGQIADQYKDREKPNKCARRLVQIDVDSAFNTPVVPFVQREFCNCDTIDIEITNIPDGLVFIGILSEGDIAPTFSKFKRNIRSSWWADIVIMDTFQFSDYSFSIYIDFDECP